MRLPRPDYIELNYLAGKGEFSLRSQESFEKHLANLYRATKNVLKRFKVGKLTEDNKDKILGAIKVECPLWH